MGEPVTEIVRKSDMQCMPAQIPELDLCRLAEAFIASRDVTQSSRLTYRRALKAFFDWLSRTGCSDRIKRLNRFDILGYKDEIGRTKRPATANMYLFVVQKFFGWLQEHRLYADVTTIPNDSRRTACGTPPSRWPLPAAHRLPRPRPWPGILIQGRQCYTSTT